MRISWLVVGLAAALAAPAQDAAGETRTPAGLLLPDVPGEGDLYVSPDGDDAWSGTLPAANAGGTDGPFRTLERARDTLRINRDATRPVSVWLTPGVHERRGPFELDERDSGTPAAPVVYRSLPGERARLLGGRILPSGVAVPVTDAAVLARIIDPEARPHIRQIDLAKLGIDNYGTMRARGFRRPYVNPGLEVFIDGVPLELARWPNEGTVPIGKVLDTGAVPRSGDYSERGGVFQFDYERPHLWTQAKDIWLSGLFGVGYADDTIRVASIDLEQRTITMAQSHMYGIKSGHAWQAYYVLNLLEEINRPGEYYLDRDSGILYFYPPTPAGNPEIAISLLDAPLVCLEGASHVIFRDLVLEVSRGMGVYIERGEGCILGGCEIRNLGSVGVCIGRGIAPLPVYKHEGTGEPISRELGSWHEHIYENPAYDRQGGSGHLVVGCDIHQTGAGGISLGGGDRVALTPAGNVVRNCHIHHFNRLDRSYKAAVNIDGVGNRVEHCFIHDCPNNAIYLHGNDHVIQFNDIRRTCVEADDMGSFYMGRDPSEAGNVIRHNLWYRNGTDLSDRFCDIYFDDGSSGVEVYGNIFLGSKGWASVFVHGGTYHDIVNNLFIDCDRALRLSMWDETRWQQWLKGSMIESRLRQHVRIEEPPYRERYPRLAKIFSDPATRTANRLERNVLIGAREAVAGPATVGNNLLLEKDPGFASLADLDFRLPADHELFRQLPGFEPIPGDEIGLRLDGWRRALPLAEPIVLPPDGILQKGETLQIGYRGGGAVLRYTTDDTQPTAESPVAPRALAVEDGQIITVRAFSPNGELAGPPVRVPVRIVLPQHPLRCSPDGWIGHNQVAESQGVNVGPAGISHCDNGDWVAFGPFDFDQVKIIGIEVEVGIDPKYAGQKTHLRLGTPNGPQATTFVWESTGSFHTFAVRRFELPDLQGEYLLYWCFEGTSGICNLRKFRFLTP
jgi:hypothetical protein